MTKAKETPKYELKDFFTKTNNETPVKMDLMLNDKPTGHYLMVKGAQAKSVQRAIINAQVPYSDFGEAAKNIKGKADREEFTAKAKEDTEIQLALNFITGWSFGEMDSNLDELTKLLTENKGLALSVFGFASTASNYLQKK